MQNSSSVLKNWYSEKNPINLNAYQALVVIAPYGTKTEELKKLLEPAVSTKVLQFLKRRKFKFKASQHISFDISSKHKFSCLILPKKFNTFSSLELAREVLSPLKTDHPSTVVIRIPALLPENENQCIDSFVSTAVALNYEPPKYSLQAALKKPKKDSSLSLSFKFSHGRLSNAQKVAMLSEASALKTNLVRHLTQRAGNDLTPLVYVKTASEMAKNAGLKTEFFSISDLLKLKAGAFIAVAKGASENSSGILKLSYHPNKAKRKIALVGKGITFDTGGNNLKTGSHMFGMNNDMAGSAVVLALCLLAAEEQWPIQITGYMAITENVLSEKSYRPNDVITSLKGKTIEVIDTDAEGRMILADTLTLASREKPDLVIDFATLTGSVIRALGTQYSGGYSNRKYLLSLIRKAGVLSGERVWSFPNDKDYGRCLKSEIADIKQCRLTGGVDHIEAAYFLSQFIEKGVDWVHIDLGAMEPEEPLAHIPKKPSGFGVRFAKKLIELSK